MLKILKFDFYKITHSVWFKCVAALQIVMTVMTLVTFPYNSISILCLYSQLLSDIAIPLILFSVLLGSMDYSNGYEKNLSESNKFLQILSKLIMIVLYILIALLFMFLCAVIKNCSKDEIVFYNPQLYDEFGNKVLNVNGIEVGVYENVSLDEWTSGNFFVFLLIKFISFFGFGSGALLFTVVVRNRVAAIVVTLIYDMSGESIWRFVDSIFSNKYNIISYSLLNRITYFGLNADYPKLWQKELILATVYFCVYVLLLFSLAYLQTRNMPKKIFEKSVSGDVMKIKELTKVYGKKKVLSDCTLNIQEGEIYGIVGNNGAGKSTLMKLICGFIKPTQGAVSFCRANDERNIKVGALIEKPGLYTGMNAFQNLKAKALCLGYDSSKETLNGLLEKVGLGDVGKKKVIRFSMGMKQRLGIALALIGDPDVLVLDEPINGLDIQGINDFRKMVLQLHNESGITVLISSHIIDELYKVAESFVVIDHGKIIKTITTEEINKEKGNMPIDEYYLSIVNGKA